jgi:hypothetical protein
METPCGAKTIGGCVIRNIHVFSQTLASNNVWRIIDGLGLWSQVIKEKYFPMETIIYWICRP